MRRSDFYYDLPIELIAQYPTAARSDSRLLVLESAEGGFSERRFSDLTQLLNPEDLLVCNNTRVVRARLYGVKTTGGRVEVLVERVLDARRALAQVRASKAPIPGSLLRFDHGISALVSGREGEFFRLRFDGCSDVYAAMESIGHVPLPPYIQRSDEVADAERYQTVYAQNPGAVAAPTAGLHFDQPLLNALEHSGVRRAFVTLHVGAGTFQPVRVDDIAEHPMHSEWMEISKHTCDQVAETRRRGGRVVAVGTTVVRALESAAARGMLRPFKGETKIFIYPSYCFRCVDAMVTNFHLPESTLLMLVCALAGRERVLDAYRHAIAQRFRFFSYGDAMFVTRAIVPPMSAPSASSNCCF